MDIKTKMKIHTPVKNVFEAIVDPSKILHFWFSSSSDRWEQGKTITLQYKEYSTMDIPIHIISIIENQKIAYTWGEGENQTEVSLSLIQEEEGITVLEVVESGFPDDDPQLIQKLLDQKEGWVYMITCLKAYLENGVHTLRGSLIH